MIDGKAFSEVKTFATTTKCLLELSEWLTAEGVTHVVMESTGIYWKPVWHILEGNFELFLANAQHVRNVPGRKSDVNDSQWLADLLAHGLIKASFVPPSNVQEARDLTRTRKQLVREGGQHSQRIQKVLEDANIKLASVVSNVMGQSGKAILRAIIAGENDPEKLLKFANSRLKATRTELSESLRGKLMAQHRFLLELHLNHVEAIETAIAKIDERIEETVRPLLEAAELLETIPGVGSVASMVIVSEIGIDMSRFPTAGHLVSWSGLCPRMDESAGRKRSTRIREGAPWLKPVLVQCAWIAVRKKDSYYGAQFARIRSRRGVKKAIIAVAASILTACYHMLSKKVEHHDLGSKHFEKRDQAKVAKRLCEKLKNMGYEVELKKAS
jgi:transposase